MTDDFWTDKLLKIGENSRVLYLHQSNSDVDSTSMAGVMDTRQLAEEVVRRWNSPYGPAEGDPPTPDEELSDLQITNRQLLQVISKLHQNLEDETRNQEYIEELADKNERLEREILRKTEALDLAARNEAVISEKLAKQYLKIEQLNDDVAALEKLVNTASVNGGGLMQQLIDKDKRITELEELIERLEPERATASGTAAGVSAVADFASSMAAGIRRIRENLEDADDKGYIEFLEEKIKEKDRRIENMVGELTILYGENYDSLDEAHTAEGKDRRIAHLEKQINELATVLVDEFGNFFDRSEGAVDMAIRLLRGFKKP